ncbi:DNA -binding domain-containing protein [Sphingopyxis sp. NJF-3]
MRQTKCPLLQARISSRVGGYSFAESPCRAAPDARVLWSRTYDASVLTASVISRLASDRELDEQFTVQGTHCEHYVVGGALRGVRIDLRGMDHAPNCRDNALRFEIALTPALPLQLTELARYWRWWNGRPLLYPPVSKKMNRGVLVLRTLDALGEGASLRAIGQHLVRNGDWPGLGESTKSQARRLVEAARSMQVRGAKTILKSGTIVGR